jgi:hypothetical protein
VKLNLGASSHKMLEVVGAGMLTACGEVPYRCPWRGTWHYQSGAGPEVGEKYFL